MKKNIVIAALLIFLIVAGMPVLNGMIMEKRLGQYFEELNQREMRSGSGTQFEIIRYDRYVFSSEIEWKIISGAFKHTLGIDELVFFDRVKHGMTGISTDTSLEKNPWFSDFVEGTLNGKNPLSVKTRFHLYGKMTSTLLFDGVSFTNNADRVDVRPGQATLSIDWRKDRILSKINFEGLNMAGRIIFDGLSCESGLERVSQNIQAGKASFFLKKFLLSDQGQTRVVSNMGVDYELVYHPDKSAVSIKMQSRLASFQSGAHEIKNASAGFDINQMDAGGYEDLIIFFQDSLAKITRTDPFSAQDIDAIRQTLEGQVREKGIEWVRICGKLLKKGLEIEVSNLKARMPEGDIKADARIRLEKDLPLAGILSLLISPAKALGYIFIDSHIILPKNPDMDDRMLLSPLYPGMSTGLFIMEADHLSHTAQTRDEKLFLNGKEVSVN